LIEAESSTLHVAGAVIQSTPDNGPGVHIKANETFDI